LPGGVEVSRPQAGVAIIVRDKLGRILVGKRGLASKRARGQWCPPGGAIEFGELIETAAARELAEETGQQIVVQRVLDVTEAIFEGEHWITVVVHAQATGVIKNREPDKCEGWSFVPIYELRSMDLMPPFRAWIDRQ
jgi:8-oxo-dGTP diphosphatase